MLQAHGVRERQPPEFPNLQKNNDFNEEKEASQDTKGGEKWNKIMGCHTFER